MEGAGCSLHARSIIRTGRLNMAKISRYNHFQPWRNGNYLAFNARSGAVAVMTAENYEAYQNLAIKLAQSNGLSPLTEAESKLLTQLEFGRFAYPDGREETELVKFQHHMERFDMTSLGLVIAPTMACNMACEYCFESNKKGKMSPAIQSAILDFIENKASSLSRVDICWYGGEPLLALDVIEDMTAKLLEMKQRKDFMYTATMITNGYLLTPEVVDKLVELKVSAIQVTLDGPARIHNRRRALKNGKDSFHKIVENIQYALTKLLISLRVNIDKVLDEPAIEELLLELKAAGLEQKLSMYFGQLEPATTVCSNIADNCYSSVDFSEVEIEYFRLLLQHGFRIEKLPSPIAVFCLAQRVNAFVIDHEGYLYRCFNYAGDPERAMGNITAPIDYQHPNFTRLFDFDAFDSNKCQSCSILPLCLGGCPSQRSDRNFTEDQLCQGWRHNLIPMLEIIACSRQQRMKTTAKEQV